MNAFEPVAGKKDKMSDVDSDEDEGLNPSPGGSRGYGQESVHPGSGGGAKGARRKKSEDERLSRWYVIAFSPALPSLSLMTHHSPPVFTPSHSRERNRVHARNTRERKKQLMDGLKGKIEALFEEVSFDPI